MLPEEILRCVGPPCFKGESDAHDRLVMLVQKNLTSIPVESRAVIFCIAYTLYCQEKKRAIRRYNISNNINSARTAYIYLSDDHKLSEYCASGRDVVALNSQNVDVELLEKVANGVAHGISQAKTEIISAFMENAPYNSDVNTIRCLLERSFPEDKRGKTRIFLDRLLGFSLRVARDASAIIGAALLLLLVAVIFNHVSVFFNYSAPFIWDNGAKYFKHVIEYIFGAK